MVNIFIYIYITNPEDQRLDSPKGSGVNERCFQVLKI